MPDARPMRRQIAIVVVAAVVLHVSSLLLVALLVLPADETGRSLLLWLLAGAGFVLSVGGVLWGVLSLPRERQEPPRAQPAPVESPAEQGNSTVINPRRQQPPGSPATPADAELQHRTGRWQTVATPWPRANEDDPNGTLIRPPHR